MIRKELDYISLRAQNIGRLALLARHAAGAGREEGYAECFYELTHEAERLAVHARRLPLWDPAGQKTGEQLRGRILRESADVCASYTPQGWFRLRLPVLLPKRERVNRAYIFGLVWPVLREFFSSGNHARFGKSVIAFVHLYDRRRPARAVRDHDNIECNILTDMITGFLLPDDSPRRLDLYCTARVADADATEVFLIPTGDFILWLETYGEDL